LWPAAHRQHRTPYTAGITAKLFDDAGLPRETAWYYDAATAAPEPVVESCFNAAAIYLELGDPVTVVLESAGEIGIASEVRAYVGGVPGPGEP